MDNKDETIIRILERKAGLSSRSLARTIGLPISTVHRRVKKLERQGVIRGYKALINYEKTRRPICALLLINLGEHIPEKGHIPKKNIIDALRKFEEIEEITEVQASHFDILVKARLQTLKKLSAFIEEIRSVEGIEGSSSAIVIEETVLPPKTCFPNSTS